MNARSPRYALVHEWLTPLATGGSELVVQEILRVIEADLFALIDFESKNPQSYLFGRSIGTTFLQHWPGARQGVQKYLPFLPLAIEQLDLREYDILLSSSHAVAKGILTGSHQLHISYCHAPMRYAWDLTLDYLQASRAGRGVVGWLTRWLLHRLRQWDVLSAQRVDYFLANSQTTARRIWRCYRRSSDVIYPPVNLDRFPLRSGSRDDFYLTVSRLVSYKQVKLMVEAFNQLGRPFVVMGGGPELAALRSIARPNVQLLGEQSDRSVEAAMGQARAFVYAAHEDFGIAPVEAQACGTPVIAFGRGGTAETVRDPRTSSHDGTGILFPEQTVAALVTAVEDFERLEPQFSRERIHQHARSFSADVFRDRYQGFVDRAWAAFLQGDRLKRS